MSEYDPWLAIPAELRSVIRAYINSEQPQDKARALEFCKEYGLDYAEMRVRILAEMVAYVRKP